MLKTSSGCIDTAVFYILQHLESQLTFSFPSFFVSWMGHAAVIDALLDVAVDVNTTDLNSGWAPLHFAARFV